MCTIVQTYYSVSSRGLPLHKALNPLPTYHKKRPLNRYLPCPKFLQELLLPQDFWKLRICCCNSNIKEFKFCAKTWCIYFCHHTHQPLTFCHKDTWLAATQIAAFICHCLVHVEISNANTCRPFAASRGCPCRVSVSQVSHYLLVLPR